MTLDVTYGNIGQEEADRLGSASTVNLVMASPMTLHVPGDTEPWISRLVADFIVARGARTVLETGCFTGATSVFIYDALCRLGGGHFWLCDIDEDRMRATLGRLPLDGTPYVHGRLNVLDVLRKDSIAFDLAWVDDDHTKAHVTRELTLLYPKMNPGGLILLHDVFGSTDLRTVVRQFGGYSLDFPRLGPAGGLGIIQCP